MEEAIIQAEPRANGKGPARQARRQGKLPAVLYGKNVDPISLAVERRTFEKIVSRNGTNVLFHMQLPGGSYTAMVREIQRDPVTDELLHADFEAVSLQDKIRVKVPVVVEGAEVVGKAGGIIQHQLREVEVECLATQVPDALTIDVSHLKVGEFVTVGDLATPPGVHVLEEPGEVVASVVVPKQAQVEEPAAAEATPAEAAHAVGKAEAAHAGGKPEAGHGGAKAGEEK